MLKQTLLAAAVLLATTSAAEAQITAGATLSGATSQDERIDRALGAGVYANYSLNNDRSLVVRGDVNWLNHGWERRAVQDMDLESSNDIVIVQVGPEFSPVIGRVRPYVGVRAGFAYFLTQASTRRSEQNLDVINMVEQHDAVFAYGAHAGLRVPIRRTRASFDVGVEYQRSDEAVMLTKGSVSVDSEGRLVIDSSRGSANFWGFRIGASVPIKSH
jgi:hypothetical protein